MFNEVRERKMSNNQTSGSMATGLIAALTLFIHVVVAFVLVVMLLNITKLMREARECSKAYVSVQVIHASGLKTTALVSKCALPPGEVQMVFPANKPMAPAEGAQM
jgi:hypothetical protein